MSTALDDAPASAATGDDDLDHIVCCDDNLTLCGLDAEDMEWGNGWAEKWCPMCVLAEAEAWGCTAPGCPVARINHS